MAQVLEAVHRPEAAVVVLQNVLKAPHPQQALQDTPGHQATISEAAAVQLTQPERRKVEGMLAAAQVRLWGLGGRGLCLACCWLGGLYLDGFYATVSMAPGTDSP
jgi:hypothetical protein